MASEKGLVFMFQAEPESLSWRKSSFTNGSCVEVAAYGDGRIAVRNSKRPAEGFLLYDADEWKAFLAGVHNGEFDDLVDA